MPVEKLDFETPRHAARTFAEKLDLAIRIVRGNADPSPLDAIAALDHLAGVVRARLTEYHEREEAERVRKPTRRTPVAAALQKQRDDMAKAAHQTVWTLFDTLHLGGRPIGEVWYHELEKLRHAGLFEAALVDFLLKHTVPTSPMRIRDMISEKALKNMVVQAEEAAKVIAEDWDSGK